MKLSNSPQKVEQLNELAWENLRTNPNTAYSYAEMADSIATIIGDTLGKATSYVRKGVLACYDGDYIKANDYYKKTLFWRKSVKDWIGVANVLNNLAFIQLKENNYEMAKKYYLDGLNLLSDDENPIEIRAKILNNLGDLYKKDKQYNQAIETFEIAQQERIKLDDIHGLSKVLLNQGSLYLEIRNFEKSEKCYLEGLNKIENSNQESLKAKFYFNLGALYFKTYQLKLALQFCEKALPLKKALNYTEQIILYNNLGAILQELGEKQKAKGFYLENINLSGKSNNKVELARALYNTGHIGLTERKYEEALKYLISADSTLLAHSEPILKSQILNDLASVYNNLERYEQAFSFNQQYSLLRDSLLRGYLNTTIYQRNQEENQKEIAQLKFQNAKLLLQSSEAKRQNQYYMGLGLIFFITILGGIAAFVAYRNRQQQLMAEYQAEQAYSKIDDLLITQELSMANAKLKAKDETELRIAKDLHDRLGAMLSTIKLYFNDVNDQLKTVKLDISPQHQKANELLDEACSEVRLIAHNMVSATLKNFGLVESLRELVNTLNGSNQIQAKLYTHGIKKRLNSQTERKIYKIILELTGNVLKHAEAKKLNIQLNQIEEELNILIEDDGKGFNPEKVEGKTGMGLKNITLRVASLNGRFHIDSGKGNGTTIAIDIPVST